MRTVITGEAVQLELPPASVAVRGTSLLIDLALYVLIYIGIQLLFGYYSGQIFQTMDPAMYAAFSISTLVLCFVILPIVIETLSRGRSLGRLIMGVRIVRDDGGTVRMRHALIRGLVGFPEIFITLGMLPLFCGMLNARGKRLGDMAAGTYGILVRQPKIRPMMLPVPQHLTSWTQIADLGRIPDRLALRLSRLLRRMETTGRGDNIAVLHRTADQLAEELRPHISPPPPPATSLEFLTAVMAERRNREYRRMRRQQDRTAELGRRLHTLPYS
ncbi:RDD family protein [Nesterenkonia sp. HG001]|uniref:RDD family protein n=1 Tax=Nesterenkonia sp. HG001 TaxID=2983207 RepID=UPI002AC7281A|nr:RDD family protein [Nesterenkonia sp. HG001]MDZ5076974.1 RDD family protein [Nesterenkonia sp. HG001]